MIDWWDLLAVHGTLKGLLQHHSSRAILWCSSPWASLRTTYTEEEGPLLITSLPTGKIWASWSSQEKKKNLSQMQPQFIIPCRQNTPKISHALSARHCREVTHFDNHLFVDFGIYILCDKYPVRYEVFLFLLFHMISFSGSGTDSTYWPSSHGMSLVTYRKPPVDSGQGAGFLPMFLWKTTSQLQRRDV